MCEASNDGVHEPRLVSRSYGAVLEFVLPPDAYLGVQIHVVVCDQSSRNSDVRQTRCYTGSVLSRYHTVPEVNEA